MRRILFILILVLSFCSMLFAQTEEKPTPIEEKPTPINDPDRFMPRNWNEEKRVFRIIADTITGSEDKVAVILIEVKRKISATSIRRRKNRITNYLTKVCEIEKSRFYVVFGKSPIDQMMFFMVDKSKVLENKKYEYSNRKISKH